MKPAYDDVMTARYHCNLSRGICQYKMNYYFCSTIDRGVAQPGLEYSSGERGVGSSNLLTPTIKQSHRCESDGGFAFQPTVKSLLL